MAVCVRCGATDADTYIFCSERREYICRVCERQCINYRRDMLPNGTHCMAKYLREDYRRRLLNRLIPALPSSVETARVRYQKLETGRLFEEFERTAAKYGASSSEEYRASTRTELAAMQAELKSRSPDKPFGSFSAEKQ